jgi:hypothetical protein
MYKNIVRILVLTVIITLLSTPLFAEECGKWCKRNWILKERNLVMPPEYAEKLKAYRDCTQQYLDQHGFDTVQGQTEMNQMTVEAEDACAEFKPTEGNRGEYELNVFEPLDRLVEAVTTECFRTIAPDAVGSERALFPDREWGGNAKPQYYFELTFETGLGGVDQFEYLGVMEPLRSRLTISLYYDGDEPELVKTWQTNSKSNMFRSHRARMLSQTGRLGKDKPMENVCRDWERTPVTCQVKPEKEMVEEGEEIRVELTDFADDKGESSREFNRIIVQVNWGEILNGVRFGGNPKMAIFKVGDGSIDVQYKAPDTTALGSDLISIFSCCDVGKEAVFPMEETQPCKRIAQQEIPIARTGVTVHVTRKSSSKTDYTKESELATVETTKWTETSEIKILMTFAENPRVDISFDTATMKMKPRRYVYALADYAIISGNYSASGSSEETVGSGQYIKRHITRSSSESGTFLDLKPSNKDSRLIITVDPVTGKATEISIPGMIAVLSTNRQYEWKGEKKVAGRMEPFSGSNPSQDTRDFGVVPHTSDQEECFEISGGDGLAEIRGKCSERKTTSRGSKEETYEWVIYKRD